MTENRFKLEGGQILLDEQEWDAIGKEIVKLRAEVEQLKRALALVSKAGRADNDENERLQGEASLLADALARQQTEVDRLRGIAWEHGNRADGAEAEVERLRAENRGLTETIEEWQEIHGTFVANPEVERLTRQRDAARMIVGPLSERPDLLDACDDVVREVSHLKRVIESKNELIDRLVTKLAGANCG